MKIGIDARFYGPESKGLGRYTEQLIKHLERIDCDNDYVIFLRKENYDSYTPQNKRFKKKLANFGWYSFSEQIIFPFVLYKANCDIIHFPHFNVPLLYLRRFIVTIHDLILLRYPTVRSTTLNPLFYWIKFLAYKIVIYNAVMRAHAVCAVSEFTRRDIIAHYPRVDKLKVTVTYEAAYDLPKYQRGALSDINRKYGIIRPYIMYVGNAYPHKNLERLISAFVRSNAYKTHDLILIGKDDFFYNRLIEEHVKAKNICNVQMIPSVSDASLCAFYAQARAFIFPSLYEGFGLPPLEAMSHKCPVAASDASCIPEIVGDAAILFDAKDVISIAEAIDIIADTADIANDGKLRKQLVERGMKRIAKYSWESTAKETLNVYKNIKNGK